MLFPDARLSRPETELSAKALSAGQPSSYWGEFRRAIKAVDSTISVRKALNNSEPSFNDRNAFHLMERRGKQDSLIFQPLW
jgi:hypothetical protein